MTESTEVANGFTGMIDMLDMMMLIMLVGFGIYGIYSALRLRKEQLLFPNKFLYPGKCDPDACLDPGEFIDYIVPRALLLGMGMLLMGALFALNVYVLHIESWAVDLATIVLPVGIIVWYCVVQRKAARLYWGEE